MSNGATTEDITGVAAGTYSCTVSVPGGCTETYDYVVGSQSNGTTATASIVNEECSNSAGGIDLTVSGGSGTYTYVWSTTETIEDITELNPGTYSVVVTTDTGCDTTMSLLVGNTASLDEEALLSISMTILPNPAQNHFVISYERQVQSMNAKGVNEMLIDASELSASMYFVTLPSNKLVKTERLVISSNK